MDETIRMHRPGEKVPVSGIYECTCGEGHRFTITSTNVQGHSFPPVPENCSGIGWNLMIPARVERSP